MLPQVSILDIQFCIRVILRHEANLRHRLSLHRHPHWSEIQCFRIYLNFSLLVELLAHRLKLETDRFSGEKCSVIQAEILVNFHTGERWAIFSLGKFYTKSSFSQFPAGGCLCHNTGRYTYMTQDTSLVLPFTLSHQQALTSERVGGGVINKNAFVVVPPSF